MENQNPPCCENQCAACKCKVPLIISGIIFSLGMLVAGVYLGRTYFPGSRNVVPTPTVSAPTVQPTVDPTANWKTYKNEKYGFEFKYPAEFEPPQMKEQEGVSILFYGKQFTLGLAIHDMDFDDLQTWVFEHSIGGQSGKVFFPVTKDKISPSTINGQQGFEWTEKSSCSLKEGCTADVYSKAFSNNKRGYVFSLIKKGISQEDKQIFDQILSTFKFTEKIPPSPTVAPKQISILSTESWISVSQNGVGFKIPEGATCVSQYNPEVKDTKNCKFIYLKGTVANPITIEVTDYQNGSRREQFFKGTTPSCREIYEDAIFGNVAALQIAAESGWCQGGAGGIVAVVGNKFVVFNNLFYDSQTKEINRFPERDTIISTLQN